METVKVTALRRTLVSASCYQQEHVGSTTLLQQNPPVLNLRCQLTHIVLYNGHKTTVVIVAVAAAASTLCLKKSSHFLTVCNFVRS